MSATQPTDAPEEGILRFEPSPGHRAAHLFVFLHGGGATARSMVSVAFKFQARFPSAALAVPEGFDPLDTGGAGQQWFALRGLSDDNRLARVEAMLPRLASLVRAEQSLTGVSPERTVLVGFSQGGTVVLEAAKSLPALAGAVVAFSARFARLPLAGARLDTRVHLVHGEHDAIVSRVHSERASRMLEALQVPVTLDIVGDLGHALNHQAVSIGSLRLLQGLYQRRRATLH